MTWCLSRAAWESASVGRVCGIRISSVEVRSHLVLNLDSSRTILPLDCSRPQSAHVGARPNGRQEGTTMNATETTTQAAAVAAPGAPAAPKEATSTKEATTRKGAPTGKKRAASESLRPSQGPQDAEGCAESRRGFVREGQGQQDDQGRQEARHRRPTAPNSPRRQSSSTSCAARAARPWPRSRRPPIGRRIQ
jgi:hypothetical protein